MTMFIACAAGSAPLVASVPAARAVPPLAPAGVPSTSNGSSEPDSISGTQINGCSNGQGGGSGGGSIAALSIGSGASAPAEVIAAAAASSDRALRGELSSVAAELRVTTSELADWRHQSRYGQALLRGRPASCGRCHHCGLWAPLSVLCELMNKSAAASAGPRD